MNSERQSGTATFLFTDIEGSTRLWEQESARMREALERHDAIARNAVQKHRGILVKMTGDGLHAAFEDPVDAIGAVLQMQHALADQAMTNGVELRVRCGIHLGTVDLRDGDYFGSPVNRAARIMGAAHGGQTLLSQAVVDQVRDRLPDAVSLRDLGSIRLRDLTSPERVYQIVHPQLRKDYPALRSLEVTPNNLPQQVTSFVGREREFADIRKALGTTRLLTLVGMGGIGKTRLSLQVAADLIDDFPDGVWFVELAPLADPRLVPQVVASVLGVKEDAGNTVNEALARYVKDRQLLLVLDNCEQVVSACAELAKTLLRSGPSVKVLASSREHLHVTAETTYAVPPLTLPDPHDEIALDTLTQYEGVRLFVDRAMAARSAFKVTQRNAAAVVQICQRLDGIPLAIELAAARVRGLSVENIAARLNDRFGLLTKGERTALPRQQTLRALIDWSYDLLTVRERALFRRLAVFAGGWTLESAEAVCAGGDVDQGDVIDLLTALVEKSLVAVDVEGARYGLLETVREYARERLSESGEADEVRTRHLAFHVAIAEAARAGLAGPEQAAWLTRLDLERENLLAAHAWCDHAEDGGELGLRFVYGLQTYFSTRGVLELGRRVAADALNRAGAQTRSLARCKALFAAGWLSCHVWHYDDAKAYLEESQTIARELGDKRRIASALQPLSLAYSAKGDLAMARTHAEEALAFELELGSKHQVAAALIALAQVHRLEGDLDRAEPLFEQAIVLAREDEKHHGIAIGLLNVAMVSIGRGRADRARELLLDVIAIADKIGPPLVGHSVLEVSAGLAALLEEWERAARFFGAVEAHTGQTGLHRDPADEAFLAPLIARARQSLGEATFAGFEQAGRSVSYDQAFAEARAWLEESP